MTRVKKAEYLGISKTTVLTYERKGIDFEEIINLLYKRKMSVRTKKNFIYDVVNIREDIKDKIWEQYMTFYLNREY